MGARMNGRTAGVIELKVGWFCVVCTQILSELSKFHEHYLQTLNSVFIKLNRSS
jgi:hypothetical protein